ncbi:MAG: LytTR family transcriptional regulator DNA-binding domain-containing protein [Prevotellaceae bacterium]|jgi:DNA-binding LytR/AlgR family response regulator|nr:LytTR family transcriptional regulator DNA-binding domain-containing protein [Prevotellaceae bacterium]
MTNSVLNEKKVTKSKNTENLSQTERIKIRDGNRVVFLELDKIVYFIASLRKSKLIDTGGNLTVVSHSLCELEQLLPKPLFVRAGRHYLINTGFLHEVDMRKKICTLQSALKTFVLENLSERSLKTITKNSNFSISI